jgi:outer membrane lipoprotein-sorting protein
MVGFADETLNSIVLMDGLGNETRLVLSNVQRNIDLDETAFEFDPPDGVDVIE